MAKEGVNVVLVRLQLSEHGPPTDRIACIFHQDVELQLGDVLLGTGLSEARPVPLLDSQPDFLDYNKKQCKMLAKKCKAQ